MDSLLPLPLGEGEGEGRTRIADIIQAWFIKANRNIQEYPVASCMYNEWMKRTTISLPDDLAIILEREAQRQATSVSEIARQALNQYLGWTVTKRHIPFAGIGESGYRHTARDFEDILAEEWGSSRSR